MMEIQLSRDLVKALREGLPNSVVFKHTDVMTAGVPDISVTWLKCSSWLEVKVASRGRIKGRGLQLETCRSLERVGMCWYVIYDVWTHVAAPSDVAADGSFKETFSYVGTQHGAVVEFLRRRHVAMERQ